MKKIIIFLVLVLTSSSVSASQYSSTIDKIENSLFGFTYTNESETQRVNRIEESVYGKSSSEQMQTRIAKLKKDLSVDQMGKEIEPKEDTFTNPEDSWVTAKEPAESSKMDYPTINELEKEVFKKEFKEQNLNTRLTNLEKKTFGKSYDNDDLSSRVDRLKAEIKPKTFMANGMDQQENNFYNDTVGKMDQNYHLDQYGPTDFDYDMYNNRNNNFSFPQEDDYFSSSSPNVFKPAKQMSLSSIEKALYKTKFENESTSNRLSRIESSVFGTNFANDSDSERLARISSAINAQKSAKRYDSNKFTQNMATAVQIGTLILMVLACIL
ncbi:hypothetical protein HDR58_02845 [bacterium]|nr:hypothetical protein [bacterium]